MKDYITNFFTYFGCMLQQDEHVLHIDLTPELAEHFGKPTLQLVFRPEYVNTRTELVAHGSYITGRIYDVIKSSGEKVAMTLPVTQCLPNSTDGQPPFEVIPWHCTSRKQHSREVRRTEVFLTFRIAYYSNEKFEELVTVGIDVEGNLRENAGFPYTLESLQEAEFSRFPYTRQQTKVMYDRCLAHVKRGAEQQANNYQEKLAAHYHQDILRLAGYYQQMIEEIPELTINREEQVRQFQTEYEHKASEELKKCQVQVSIEPVSFCAVTIPFRRFRYKLLSSNGLKRTRKETTIDVHYNLFSGEVLYPRCESCGQPMKTAGICEVKSHPVCQDCLVQCHECGTYVCRDCGIEQCAECGEWVCHQCSEPCHVCEKRVCTKHIIGCVECQKDFCPHCATYCEECGKLLGTIHVAECEISHKKICFDCLVTCSCCGKQVSSSHASTCSFCGQQMCDECTFRCEVCGGVFCVHHVMECELSGKMVCAHHSGTCELCSKQVSTEFLKKCDVCGMTVCTECALQCHECHVYFCKEHEEEVTTCPECGKTYCHLCYSGQGVCTECQKKAGNNL